MDMTRALVTRTLADRVAASGAVDLVKCPECGELVRVNGAGWLLHQQHHTTTTPRTA